MVMRLRSSSLSACSTLLSCIAVLSLVACTADDSTSTAAPSNDGGTTAADSGPPSVRPDSSVPDTSRPTLDAMLGVEAGGSDGEAGSGATPVPSGPSGSWKLAWSDEFNGTSLDATKWNSGWLTGPKSTGHGNTTAVTDSQQSGTYFGPAAFSFPGDGALHIRLSGPVDPGAHTGFGNLESGLITTAGLWNIDPGSTSYAGAGQSIQGGQVIEIRARLAGPVASGADYWPAFWMTNAGNYNGGGQSYSEEVDLLEGLGNGSEGQNLEFHLHAASEYGGVRVVPSSEQNTDFSLAYHTYTFSFSTTKIQCWSDGTLVPGVNPTSAEVSAQWGVPQYLMLAFQATAGAAQPTSAAGTPNDLMLDYVRIWTAN